MNIYNVTNEVLESSFPTRFETPESFLLIEDHPFFIDGLSNAIKQLFPEVNLLCATSASDAIKLLKSQSFDLVFLDLNLPDKNGFELLEDLSNSSCLQPIVILTGLVTYRIAEQAQQKGAIGALSKSLTLAQLHKHCLSLLKGETVYEVDALLQPICEDNAQRPTGRELDVLAKLEEGLDNTKICCRLNISDSTLRTHLRNLFSKLGVSNRTACLVQARKLGWM